MIDQFELKAGSAHAIGFPVGSNGRTGFVVRAGSTSYIRSGGADRNGTLPLKRQELVDAGILMPHPKKSDLMVFLKDHHFSSPTAAGDIVNGANISAPQHWILIGKGVSLKEWLARP